MVSYDKIVDFDINTLREIEIDELTANPNSSLIGATADENYQFYLLCKGEDEVGEIVKIAKSKVISYLDDKEHKENKEIIDKLYILVSQIFDTRTEPTEYDRGCRNTARLFLNTLTGEDIEELE